MPNKLFQLQKAFVEALTQTNGFPKQYVESKTLVPEKHFNIYHDSILGNFQKTLKLIYPVCCKLVGDEFFIFMINQYIVKTPSTSFDLGNYGQDLSDFIQIFPQAESIPYLSDVAKLEWAWHVIEEFSTLITSPYPLHRIWETNQDDFVGEDEIVLEDNLRYFFLVWQKDSVRKIDLLDEEEFLNISEA